MKEYIILVLVILLILIPNIYFKNYLRSSGDELIALATELKDKLVRGNVLPEDANQLHDAFLEREKIWILIVDHDMLDEIENEIHECVAFYDTETINEFMSSYSKVMDAIQDLAKREEFSLANIF